MSKGTDTKTALGALTTEDTGGWETVGGMEPIKFFYNYKAPKEARADVRILTVNAQIIGFYEGSFKPKNSKGKALTHKIRTDEGLVAVGGSGQLDKALTGVANGTEVRITYRGKTPIASGEFKGSLAHNFMVQKRTA